MSKPVCICAMRPWRPMRPCPVRTCAPRQGAAGKSLDQARHRRFVVKVNGRIRNRKYLTQIQAINACAYIMAGVEPARALRRARGAV